MPANEFEWAYAIRYAFKMATSGGLSICCTVNVNTYYTRNIEIFITLIFFDAIGIIDEDVRYSFIPITLEIFIQRNVEIRKAAPR